MGVEKNKDKKAIKHTLNRNGLLKIILEFQTQQPPSHKTQPCLSPSFFISILEAVKYWNGECLSFAVLFTTTTTEKSILQKVVLCLLGHFAQRVAVTCCEQTTDGFQSMSNYVNIPCPWHLILPSFSNSDCVELSFGIYRRNCSIVLGEGGD